nr:hypothetical protein [Rhodopila globiformis]
MSMQMEDRTIDLREGIDMPGVALRGFVAKHATRRLSGRRAQRVAKRGVRRNPKNVCKIRTDVSYEQVLEPGREHRAVRLDRAGDMDRFLIATCEAGGGCHCGTTFRDTHGRCAAAYEIKKNKV